MPFSDPCATVHVSETGPVICPAESIFVTWTWTGSLAPAESVIAFHAPGGRSS